MRCLARAAGLKVHPFLFGVCMARQGVFHRGRPALHALHTHRHNRGSPTGRILAQESAGGQAAKRPTILGGFKRLTVSLPRRII